MPSEALETQSPSEESKMRQFRVRFLADGSWEKDPDVNAFLRFFNVNNFVGELVEQKITKRVQNQKGESARPLDPSADLYAVRRWQYTLLQQPNSAMLVKVERIKDTPLVIPLIMEELFKNNRSVLIAGTNASLQRQLQTHIDLEFKTIPAGIDADSESIKALLKRAQRPTGFQNSLRNIGTLSFLKEEIQEKINTIQVGNPFPPLDEAEIINLCLLADLCSRYEEAIQSFTQEYQERGVPFQTLSTLFDTLTQGITPPDLIRQFLPFVDEEDQANVKNKALLCRYIYQNLLSTDKSAKKDLKRLRPAFNQRLREVVIQQRIETDMALYRRSFFIAGEEDTQQLLRHMVAPVYKKLDEFIRSGEPALSLEQRVELCKFFIQTAKKGKKSLGLSSPENNNPSHMVHKAMAQSLAKHRNAPESQPSEQLEMEQRVARKIFAQMHLQHFDLTSLWNPKSANAQLLEQPKELLRQLLSIEMERTEITGIFKRLENLLFPYKKIVNTVQKRFIETIERGERQKMKALEYVYVLHSLPEVVHYRFDLGNQSLHPLERTCAQIVLAARLGLDLSLKPRKNSDVTLFEDSQQPRLGVLQNDPLLVAKSYVTLLGNRVSDRVKHFTDYKINHLMKTYRKNFFEMLYEFVVVQDDTPISRDQLVQFLRSHNILANLMDKGWEEGNRSENFDPMLPLDLMEGKEKVVLPDEFKNFDKMYQAHFQNFIKFVQEIKKNAQAFPQEDNPDFVLWSLFQKGVYNLMSPQAKKLLRKSAFYKTLQSFIAYTYSKHYKNFTGEITAKGVSLFIPRKYRELLFVGTHFSFLVKDQLVRYSLLPSPASLKELDKLSYIFSNEFDEEVQKDTPRADVDMLFKMVMMVRRWNRIWSEFSRSLTIACVDRILSETSVKMVAPGKILPQHIKFSVPDHEKLCLGKAATSGQTIEFSKFLNGFGVARSILHFHETNMTTLDEFAIVMDRIDQTREELIHYQGLAQDLLNILQTLTYHKIEAPFVAKMESALEWLVQVLSKPLRNFTEEDLQTAHKIAKNLKILREKLHDIRLESKNKRFITKLREELSTRRSDSHLAKIEFSNAFILPTAEMRFFETIAAGKKQQGTEEVKIDSDPQTVTERIRMVIRIHDLLEGKKYIIFAPEGQKKQQINYLLSIIRTLIALMGKSIQFYLDTTTLYFAQQQQLAQLIKPSHFYQEVDLTVETDLV